MDYKVIVQPRAETDVIETFRYIAERTPEGAERWYRRLKSEIQSLAKIPSRCPTAPESAKLGIELRQLHFGKRSGAYRIVFSVDKTAREVQVLAVRHAARKPLDITDL